MRSATGTRGRSLATGKAAGAAGAAIFTVTRTSGELDRQALAHKGGSILLQTVLARVQAGWVTVVVAGVHGGGRDVRKAVKDMMVSKLPGRT